MDKQRSIRDFSRRDALKILGAGSAAILVGFDPMRPLVRAANDAGAAALPTCVVRPEQTEGPYFVDDRLERSDIRVDPSDHSTKPGVPLRLEFQISRVAGAACAPLNGAIVDVWHCDALGAYSDVRDRGFDTRGRKFLRGYQATGANGMAEFLTIYPSWYPGRAVHIHFKIRSAAQPARAREFTSQLYFDEAVSAQVLQQPPYNDKRGARTLNDADFLFRRGGKQLLLAPVKDARGYRAKFDIALDLS